MTSDRPYRKTFSWQDCLQEIKASRATQLDAVLVDATETLWPRWERKWGRQEIRSEVEQIKWNYA